MQTPNTPVSDSDIDGDDLAYELASIRRRRVTRTTDDSHAVAAIDEARKDANR